MIIYMENNEKEKKEKTGWVAELISWVQVLVSAAVIAFVLTTFVIANSEIPATSATASPMAFWAFRMNSGASWLSAASIA